jgi:putative ubiquitin-RnfH superfamily antitoxin RatB of RatAB toxin-antitoxin module
MLDGSIGFAGGRLTKIAVIGLSETFEDSAVITQSIVQDMASDIINERRVVLSKNSRITKLAKIGDKVEVNDPLIIFEEVGADDELTLASLEKLDVNTASTIEELARSTAKAKFSGEIFDIQIFYNTDLDNLHPSLRKVVTEYAKKYNAKAKYIDKAREDEFVHQPSTEKLDSEKILGDDVEGVVIQYFIKHKDKCKVGDKLTFQIAAKTIIAETIEEGLEPYSEFKPDEEVSAFLSPLSLVARMIPDLYLSGYSTKIVMTLEEQCIALLEE